MRCEETKVENYYTIYKGHLNRHNTLFGGHILSWLDEVMGMVIRKYTVIPFVTATIDNYQFLDAVKVNELLIIKSYVSGVGNKSVEIFAEISAFNIEDKSTRLVGLGISTFCVRKDIVLKEKLEEIIYSNNELEKFVCQGYELRKNNKINYRDFSKKYSDLYNKGRK